MDEYQRQTITNLTQTFTADELNRAARAFTGVDYLTTGRGMAALLVASGYGVTEVREYLEGRE